MKTFLYRLRFRGPVHFGASGIGLENSLDRLSSDSLTSALLNAFAVIGDVEEVLQSLLAEIPTFTLSSLFPFGPDEKDNEMLFALPRPLINPPSVNQATLAKLGKELKRIKYLRPEDFLIWISQPSLSNGALEAIVDPDRMLARRWNPEKKKGWWTSELRPRVALDRESQNSNLWFCGTVHFHPDAGLYGLVRLADESWREHIEAAFRLLGELGIGGERTYGMGCFEFGGFEPLEAVWPSLTLPKSLYRVLLSCYYPSEEEKMYLSTNFETWDFVESRGYVTSGRTATTLKRKRVRLIKEGSVAKKPVKGTMVNVTPDNASALGLNHNVYRSGLAFLFP